MSWADKAKAGTKWGSEEDKKRQLEGEAKQAAHMTGRIRPRRDTRASRKEDRTECRTLQPGIIFIAEHYEGAGEQVDNKISPEEQQQVTPEEIAEADGVNEHDITTCQSHAQIVIKDRKFIVLSVHYQNYICIPLFTYQRKGIVGEPDQDDHVSVFDHRIPRTSLQQQSKWKTLQTKQMTPQSHRLSHNAAARVTFPLSRPKNLPIEILGNLHPDSTDRLRDLFVLLDDLALNDHAKQKLETKHGNSTWTGSIPAAAAAAVPTPISTAVANNGAAAAGPGPATASPSFSSFGSLSGSISPPPVERTTHDLPLPQGRQWSATSSVGSHSSFSQDVDWGDFGEREGGSCDRVCTCTWQRRRGG
jgi:hypothetical protein